MLLIALLAVFGNGFQYQNSFELCKEINFKPAKCEHNLKMVKANPKSKHYKD